MKNSIEAILLRVEVLISYAKQNKKDMTAMSPDFYISELQNIYKNLENLKTDKNLNLKKLNEKKR
ncbi:MAG: hypothetical protein E7184_00085 [Erysipelotrichaceae bacterium]|nr:hypothetical protein [Erysipelotrichaceae bacterium]